MWSSWVRTGFILFPFHNKTGQTIDKFYWNICNMLWFKARKGTWRQSILKAGLLSMSKKVKLCTKLGLQVDDMRWIFTKLKQNYKKRKLKNTRVTSTV